MKNVINEVYYKEFGQKSLKALFLLFFLINLNSISSFGASGTAVINSNWNNSSTWSYSGTHRLPTCGDTLTIPASKTVTVNNQNDYTACGSPMIIYVYGVFQFTTGNKLDLPCGSVVFIMSGGTVKKSTAGGGSSTLISICGTVEWKAGDGPLSGVDTLGSVISLPVELLYIGADLKEDAVKLTWTTASEVNNSHFTIEKSINGTDFFEIGLVRGAGNSTYNLDYSFVDRQPENGVAYYRLTQTDYDGRNETFDPIAFNFNKSHSEELKVFILKNPFNDVLKFSIETSEKDNLDILLFDSDGGLIFKETMTSNQELPISKIGLSNLRAGLYFLQVKSKLKTSDLVRVLKMD